MMKAKSVGSFTVVRDLEDIMKTVWYRGKFRTQLRNRVDNTI